MSEPIFVYLSGPAGRHMFTEPDWRTLLGLARDYGWLPAGTLPPPDRDELSWDGTYFPAQGQSVSAEDGARFSVALERALQDIPEQGDAPVQAPHTLSPASLAALDYYRGHRRTLIKRLAAGGRAGPIQISPEPRYAPAVVVPEDRGV